MANEEQNQTPNLDQYIFPSFQAWLDHQTQDLAIGSTTKIAVKSLGPAGDSIDHYVRLEKLKDENGHVSYKAQFENGAESVIKSTAGIAVGVVMAPYVTTATAVIGVAIGTTIAVNSAYDIVKPEISKLYSWLKEMFGTNANNEENISADVRLEVPETNKIYDISHDDNKISIETSTPLTEEQKASTLQAIVPLVKPTDDNASPIESITLNDDEYIPFNTDLSDYQKTNLLIDGETLDKHTIQSLLLNYIYKNKIFLLSWQKNLVFNYYNIKKI
jgi:tetrahydromethanopterin S-methyltransferase subunit F